MQFFFFQPTVSFEMQEIFVFVFASAAAVVVVVVVSADVLLVFDNVVLVSHDKLSLACCHEYSANFLTYSVYGLFRSKSNNKNPFRFNRPAINDTYDPGMMYYFLSTVADVSANPKINASAVYFSPNMSYTPSYRGFFNLTMPLFGPRTYRYCILDLL